MSRKLSEDLNNPYLFSEFQAGEYVYEENSVGGKTAYGSLQLSGDPARDSKAQISAGGISRRSNDHEWGADDGGHLIGARFGGESGDANLTAQSRNLNRSKYKRMENEWAEHLDAHEKVFVYIETDDPQRPNAYMGYVIYETPDGKRDYDTFHMVNESKTAVAQWEADAKAFEAEEYARLKASSQQTSGDFLGTASAEAASENSYAYESGMEWDAFMD